MRIAVTGATGFVGRHVVADLLGRGHEIIAVARSESGVESLPWRNDVKFVACDVNDAAADHPACIGVPEALVHLAWSGLPDYKGLFHFEQNLPGAYEFIKKMVLAGTPQVLVAGTCFEYGMQNGALDEGSPLVPSNPYGLAKHHLHCYLRSLQAAHPFVLKWVRLFYLYGPGQSPTSVLAQLDRSIDNGESSFNMSGGEQIRDYLPVEVAASHFADVIENAEFDGAVNCCSGQPVSIRKLVERRIIQREAHIQLNLGHYPYPDYEPLAFWGSRHLLNRILGQQRGPSPSADSADVF